MLTEIDIKKPPKSARLKGRHINRGSTFFRTLFTKSTSVSINSSYNETNVFCQYWQKKDCDECGSFVI